MALGYIAIDEGTTSAKVLAYSADGHMQASAGRPLRLDHPKPGHFEQDAAEILAAVDSALAEVVAAVPDMEIQGIAISNQRESVVAFHRSTALAVAPIIGWQDSRTAADCQRLVAAGWSHRFHEATGLHLDPMYSATKMGDLARRVGDTADAISTLDALLVAHLTGGAAYATDPTNASRTLLYNIHEGAWDRELCAAVGIDPQLLPEVRPSSSIFGYYAGPITRLHGVPLSGVVGDSHAALFGQRCRPGTGKVTFGTGSSIMIPTEHASSDPSPVDTTIAFVADDAVTYAREGNVLAAGAGVDAAAQCFRFGSVAELMRSFEEVDETHLCYVPAFSGLAAPWWDRSAEGILVGLGRDTTAAHIARAVVESVGHQLADIVDVVRAEGTVLTTLRADGGLTRDDSFVQAMADILDVSIETAEQSNISAYGAARMCALGLGHLETFDAGAVEHTRFSPQITPAARQRMRSAWRKAILRSRGLEVPQEGSSQ